MTKKQITKQNIQNYIRDFIYPMSHGIAKIRGFCYSDCREISQTAVISWYLSYGSGKDLTIEEDRRLIWRITINVCNRFSRNHGLLCSMDDARAYSNEFDVENLFLVVETMIKEKHDDVMYDAFKCQIERTLQSLSIDHKIVFFMKLNGASSKEMAEKIGKSPVHCRNILFYARKALKPIAEEYLLKLNS